MWYSFAVEILFFDKIDVVIGMYKIYNRTANS